jgi:hypothetical protein
VRSSIRPLSTPCDIIAFQHIPSTFNNHPSLTMSYFPPTNPAGQVLPPNVVAANGLSVEAMFGQILGAIEKSVCANQKVMMSSAIIWLSIAAFRNG